MEALDERFGTGSQKATDPGFPLPHNPLNPWALVPPSCVYLCWSPGGVPLVLRFLPAGECRLSDATALPSSLLSQ